MTKKLSTPFAISSTKRNDVPVTTTAAGQASYNIGFPDENFISLASGGVAPDGKDFNGVLFDITSNISDLNKGLPQYFDADFSTLINGYGIGARLCLSDNSGYVVSTVANNTQDPNSSLIGWRKVEEENNISTVEKISDLSNLENLDGRIVRVKSFYAPIYGKAMPFVGGATYIYSSAKASSSDSLFNRNGWLLQFDDTVNIYQLGFKGDATTDETALLKSVISAIKNYVSNDNINKIILDGCSSYIMLSDNVEIDLCYVGLKNIRFKALSSFQPSSYTALITYITSDSWSDVPITARKDFAVIHDNVQIMADSIVKNTIGLMIQPNIALAMQDAVFNKLKINNFDYDLVFDENSYLLIFNNCTFGGANCIYTTSFSLGTNTGTQNNMGENIRFNSCTFANSRKVFEIKKGNGIGTHNYGCSFDYCGGTASTGFEKWFDFTAGSSEFSFFGCHFESGNPNAGLSQMFYNGYRSKISLFGGEMLFSSTTYNDCEYFCYNEENGQISIEGTRIYAPSVKYWANKGLGKFTPMFNSPNNGETFITSLYTKSLAFDPNMSDSGVSDIFIAGGFTTDVLESSQVKISKGTVSINGSNTNCIQVYKKNGGGSDDSFDIYIKRNLRSNCLSSCAIKMYLSNGANISNEVSYTLSLIKSRAVDVNGIPIALSSNQIVSASWIVDTTNSSKEFSTGTLNVGDSYKGYDYYKLHCRLFNFNGQSTLCITGLGFEETD